MFGFVGFGETSKISLKGRASRDADIQACTTYVKRIFFEESDLFFVDESRLRLLTSLSQNNIVFLKI